MSLHVFFYCAFLLSSLDAFVCGVYAKIGLDGSQKKAYSKPELRLGFRRGAEPSPARLEIEEQGARLKGGRYKGDVKRQSHRPGQAIRRGALFLLL